MMAEIASERVPELPDFYLKIGITTQKLIKNDNINRII
jgi:hypothetical protein